MALQSSGAISISQIRNEQVNNGIGSTYSLRQLSANAGKGTPDYMSEFYGYSAAPACPPSGQYAYTDCGWNPAYGCVESIDYYHNGSCGYYESYSYSCVCY